MRVTKQVTAQTPSSFYSSCLPVHGTRARSRRRYAVRGSTAHQPAGSPSKYATSPLVDSAADCRSRFALGAVRPVPPPEPSFTSGPGSHWHWHPDGSPRVPKMDRRSSRLAVRRRHGDRPVSPGFCSVHEHIPSASIVLAQPFWTGSGDPRDADGASAARGRHDPIPQWRPAGSKQYSRPSYKGTCCVGHSSCLALTGGRSVAVRLWRWQQHER